MGGCWCRSMGVGVGAGAGGGVGVGGCMEMGGWWVVFVECTASHC